MLTLDIPQTFPPSCLMRYLSPGSPASLPRTKFGERSLDFQFGENPRRTSQNMSRIGWIGSNKHENHWKSWKIVFHQIPSGSSGTWLVPVQLQLEDKHGHQWPSWGGSWRLSDSVRSKSDIPWSKMCRPGGCCTRNNGFGPNLGEKRSTRQLWCQTGEAHKWHRRATRGCRWWHSAARGATPGDCALVKTIQMYSKI